MDNNFLNQLLEQERELEQEISDLTSELGVASDKLRLLREFKEGFFKTEYVQVSVALDPENLIIPPLQTTIKAVRPYKKRKKASIPQKVFNALKAIAPANTQQVADKLVETHAEYKNNREKAVSDARVAISDFKKAGKIEVEQEGNGRVGSTYRIKAA